MTMTKTTDTQDSGGTLLSDDAVDFYIRAEAEEHGKSKYKFRAAFRTDDLPEGNGLSYKFVRFKRLVLADATAEGVGPTATQLESEIITATSSQYVQSVEVSDIAQLALKHKLVKIGMRELAEAFIRRDDAMIQNVALGCTNVTYGDGTVADRPSLASTNYLTTNSLRKGLIQLESTDDVDGEAPTNPSGSYTMLANNRHIQDLLSDADFKATAIQSSPEELRSGIVKKWSNFDIMKNTFGPKFTNLGATAGAVGVSFADSASGGALSDDTYYFTIVKSNKRTKFKDGISAELSHAISNGGATQSITVTMPTSAGSEFDVYMHTTTGATLLSSSRNASAAEVVVTAVPSGTASPPAAPASGVTVYTSYGFGYGSVALVDLKSLETFLLNTADKSDVANQKAVMATKWHNTAAIVNDLWIERFEAPSRY